MQEPEKRIERGGTSKRKERRNHRDKVGRRAITGGGLGGRGQTQVRHTLTVARKKQKKKNRAQRKNGSARLRMGERKERK